MDLTNTIYFAKGNDTVIIPTKREEDGAFDIYANFEEDYIVIHPHETKMIPTGLHSAFSSDYVAILKERGSTGSKGIGQRCGVVDSGYRGEWFVPLTNHSNNCLIITKEKTSIIMDEDNIYIPFKFGNIIRDGINYMQISKEVTTIYPYEKAICQCVMLKVPKLTTQETSMEEIMSIKSERGTGALGSSQK